MKYYILHDASGWYVYTDATLDHQVAYAGAGITAEYMMEYIVESVA